MLAQLGPSRNTIYLQRGYRQFGQPMETTLDAIVDLDLDEEAKSFTGHV